MVIVECVVKGWWLVGVGDGFCVVDGEWLVGYIDGSVLG